MRAQTIDDGRRVRPAAPAGCIRICAPLASVCSAAFLPVVSVSFLSVRVALIESSIGVSVVAERRRRRQGEQSRAEQSRADSSARIKSSSCDASGPLPQTRELHTEESTHRAVSGERTTAGWAMQQRRHRSLLDQRSCCAGTDSVSETNHHSTPPTSLLRVPTDAETISGCLRRWCAGGAQEDAGRGVAKGDAARPINADEDAPHRSSLTSRSDASAAARPLRLLACAGHREQWHGKGSIHHPNFE